MPKYPNKQIETKNAEEQDFMFPHSPTPITVRAKSREEAEMEFQKIISKDEKLNND